MKKISLIIIILILSPISISAEYTKQLFPLSSYKYKYLFWDVYEATLFGVDKNHPDILADVPKKLRFKYYKNIPASLLVEKSLLSLNRNPEFSLGKYKSQLDLINSAYLDVKAGDIYELAYNPNTGISLSYNGKSLITVDGSDFARVYFSIWLSEHSFDSELSKTLLSYKNI